MSIEIIKKPTCKCKACGCVYSFDKEDFRDDKTYLGCNAAMGHVQYEYEYRTFVTCPICGKEFVINRESKYNSKPCL